MKLNYCKPSGLVAVDGCDLENWKCKMALMSEGFYFSVEGSSLSVALIYSSKSDLTGSEIIHVSWGW